jgi:hypothetical protein
VYAAYAESNRKAMSDDQEKPKPIYSLPEQGIIPGYKKYIALPPKDWRSWTNECGEKTDAPKYRGQQFTGKIIPPLHDGHGNPITSDSLQIVRDARGEYGIIDWSLPITSSAAQPGDGNDESFAQPIMGRVVYRTRHSLERAKKALEILAHEKTSRAAGLKPDPAQCFDLKGVAIIVSKLALCQFQRGEFKDRYAIVNTSLDITSSKRGLVIRATTLKDAVARLMEEAQKRAALIKPKKKYVGPPISFDAPSGFGGFGSPSERTCPTYDSQSWDTIVTLYAKTGEWCRTARMIWPMENYPEELVEQVKNYREEYLANPSVFYDEAVGGEIDKRLRKKIKSNLHVRALIKEFGATLIDAEGEP